MNDNSKNTKSKTSTIFFENFSQNSKSAHSKMRDDMSKCLKFISEAQCLIADNVLCADFAYNLIKDILNKKCTKEEALSKLGESYDLYQNVKLDIKDYNKKISDFLEDFQICRTF